MFAKLLGVHLSESCEVVGIDGYIYIVKQRSGSKRGEISETDFTDLRLAWIETFYLIF